MIFHLLLGFALYTKYASLNLEQASIVCFNFLWLLILDVSKDLLSIDKLEGLADYNISNLLDEYY